MAWQVALVLDTEYSPRELAMLVHQMPVWAVQTADRTAVAPAIRTGAGELWTPEPAFTLFSAASLSNPVDTCFHVLGTVLEHHPSLAALELNGVPASPVLTEMLQRDGFVPASGQFHEGVAFRKPLELLSDVQDLTLDATNWESADDVYDSFFDAVRASAWHGRNFDALKDSIVTGGINGIEVPYRIVIKNLAGKQNGAREIVDQFVDLIAHFEAEGCPVRVQLEGRQ
jgi:RNAse (barnase) inhibitor barstar